MSKLVLEVQLNNLSQNDILIYHEGKGCWINVKKASLLSHLKKKDEELERKIQDLEEKNNKLNDKLNKLIEIVKENTKWLNWLKNM